MPDFGEASLRPASQVYRKFQYAIPSLESFNGQLGFNCKTTRKQGEVLHDASIEYAIPREHVLNADMEDGSRKP